MTKLRELERRLAEEPENLGLRVMVAGGMREAGRLDDAVELYRSVAIAYRDQGRSQQAIAVCRSILEIAPDDPRCHALLATLVAGHKSASPPAPAPGLGRDVLEVGAPPVPAEPADDDASGVPVRISAYDETPLPAALPYHIADPTLRLQTKLSAPELPLAEGAATRPGAGRDLDDDDDPADEALTDPRDLPRGLRRRLPLRAPTHDDGAAPAHVPPERSTPAPVHVPPERSTPAPAPVPPERSRPAALAFAFFAPLPAERRGAVLARFSRRSVPAGTPVIRQGEQGHPLVLVASGRLEVRADRPPGDPGKPVELGPIDAGDHAGEAALLARAPSPVHVVAATEAELLLLSPRDFYDVAGQYPALWAQLKELAERRTRELAARLGR